MLLVTWLSLVLLALGLTGSSAQSDVFRRYGWTMKSDTIIGSTFTPFVGTGSGSWPSTADGALGAGEAVHLDGTGDTYLTLSDEAATCLVDVSTCTEGFSLGMWMRDEYSETTSPSSDLYFLSSGGQTTSSHGVFMRYRYGGGFYEVGVLTSSGTLWLVQFTFSVRWVWTYVLFTWESSAGLTVYMDNVQVGSDTSGNAVSGYSVTGNPKPEPELTIGIPNHRPGSQAPMSVDEVIFWEKAIDSATVQPADLVCHPGWFLVGSTCYRYSYLKDETPYDNPAAEAVCAQEGGDLALFASSADADWSDVIAKRPDTAVTYFLRNCERIDTSPALSGEDCGEDTRYSICSATPLSGDLHGEPQYISGCFDAASELMPTSWGLTSYLGYDASQCRTSCDDGTYKYAAIMASSGECYCTTHHTGSGLEDMATCDACRSGCTDQYVYVYAVSKQFSQVQEQAISNPSLTVGYHYGVYLEAGRDFTVTADGGGATVWELQLQFSDAVDPVITDAMSYVYRFDDPGAYNVSWVMTNSIGSESGTVQLEVQPVQEKLLALYVSGDPSTPNNTAVIYSKLLGGKNVTCELHYGDGYVDLWEEEEPNPDQVLNHNYTSSGDYELTLICDTVSSILQACGIIKIQEEVSGSVTDAIVVATFGESLSFNWNVSSGNDITALILFDDVQVASTSTFDNETSSGTTLVAATQYSTDGTKSVTLVLYNLVSREDINSSAVIQKEINGLEVTSTSYHWLNGSVVPLTVSVAEGTDVDFIVNLGDSLTILESNCYSDSVVNTLSYNHTYLDLGVYEVQVTAANLVSYQSYCVNITIEAPIPEGITLTPSNITAHVLENMTFSLEVPDDVVPPDPLYYSLSFGDGYVQTVMNPFDTAPSFNITKQYVQQGQYFACAMVYTNTMAQNFSVVIQVEAGTQLNITTDTSILKVDEDAVTFNLSGLSGMNIEYSLNYGDDSPEYTEFRDFVYDPSTTIQTTKTYSKPGLFYPSATGNGTYVNSNASLPEPVIVQHPIVCCLEVIDVPPLLINPSATMIYHMQLTANAPAPTNVTCNFTFGEADGFRSEDLVPLEYGSIYSGVSHVFTSEGLFTTLINCSNLVSSVSTSVDIQVLDLDLEDFVITTDSAILLDVVKGEADALWLIDFHNLTYIPAGISATWDFGDSSALESKSFTEFNINHPYKDRGNYTATLDLTFQDQKRHLSWVIEVGVLNLTASPLVLRTFEEVLEVEVSGLSGNVTYLVDFGDGTSHYCGSSSASMKDINSIKKVYTQDGIYNIEAVGKNSSVSEKAVLKDYITVQHALTNLTFTGNPFHAVVPRDEGVVKFGLQPGGFPPTNTTCVVDFGEDNAPDSVPLDLSMGSEFTLTHRYQVPPTEAPVVYNVTTKCSNLVDEQEYWTNITVLEGLSGLTVSPEYPSLQVNISNTFTLSLETGSQASFYIDFGDNTTEIIAAKNRQALANHSYTNFGSYPVFVRAFNDYDEINTTLDNPVLVYLFFNVSIEDFNLTVDSNMLELDYKTNRAKTTFRVVVDNAFLPPPNISLTWIYGDGTQETEMMTSFTKEHEYVEVGSYRAGLKVVVLDKDQEGTFYQEVEVYKPCLPPITYFDLDAYKSPFNPLVAYKSKPVSIAPVTTLRCDRANRHDFRWFLTDNRTETEMYREDSPDTSGVLSLSSGTLSTGLYHVRFNVSVNGEPSTYSAEDIMYIEVVPTPLVAQISGGSGKTLGKTDILALDASQSYDPDNPGSSTLSFHWACRTMNETEVNKLAAIDPTEPVNFQEECTKLNTARRKRAVDGYAEVQGQDLEEDEYYVFQVVISTPDNRQVAARQAVLVISGDPPDIHIICTANCLGKVNVEELLAFTSMCDDCTGRETRAWELFLYSDTEDFQSVTITQDMSTQGVAGLDLLINAYSLEMGRKYKIRLTVTRDTGEYGYAEMMFLTNLPPHNLLGGECAILPEQGKANRDFFNVRCPDWVDEGDEMSRPGEQDTSLSYVFSVQYSENAEKQVIYHGAAFMTPPLPLAPGNPEINYTVTLHTTITDRYGASATSLLKVQVEPPYNLTSLADSEEGEDFLVSEMEAALNKLNNLLATGDIKALTQQIAVLASFFGQLKQPPNDVAAQLKNPEKWGHADLPDVGEDGSAISWEDIWNMMMNPEPVKKPVAAAEELTDKLLELLEKASRILSPDDGLAGITQIANGLSTVVGDGHLVTDAGVEMAVNTIVSLTDTLKDVEVNSKEKLEDAVSALVNCAGKLLNRAQIEKNPFASEPAELNEFKYDPEMVEQKARLLEMSEITKQEREWLIEQENKRTAYRQQQQKELQGKTMSQLMNAMSAASAVLAKKMIPGLEPVKVSQQGLELSLLTKSITELSGATVEVSGATILLPENLSSLGEESDPITISVISVGVNPFSYGAGADDITSNVVRLAFLGPEGQSLSLAEPFHLMFETDKEVPSVGVNPSPSKGDSSGMTYHRLWVDSRPNALVSQLDLAASSSGDDILYLAYVRADDFPTFQTYDFLVAVLVTPDADPVLLVDPDKLLQKNTSYYVGLKQLILKPNLGRQKRDTGQQHDLGNGLILEDNVGGVSLTGYDVIDPQAVKHLKEASSSGDITVGGVSMSESEAAQIAAMSGGNYSMQTASSGCRSWDADKEAWITDDCQPSGGSDMTQSDCACSQASRSDFAASFFVMPNMIDFNLVFANWDPSNVAVLAVCICLILTYIPGAIWARYMDKKDVLEWGVARMVDNRPHQRYYYLITVYTGLRKGAGTTSNIGFVLSGDTSDTGVRALKDGMRQELKRSSVMRFLMAVDGCLGTLQYLRIWHDSSGKGDKSSWYLDKVVAQDIQKDESYIFMCDQWLALDEDDGRLDRVLPAAGRENVMSFRNLFMDNARLSVTEEHLWLSLVMRPTRSNFTRVQRLSCCLSLLFLTMIANAMFYGTEGSEERPQGINLGPIKFTLGQVFIALASVIIITPLNILIITLFKKAKPKVNPFIPGKRVFEPGDKAKGHQKKFNMKLCFPSKKKGKGLDEEQGEASPADEEKLSKMLSSYVVDANEKLWPHWVAYIAYALIILAVTASAFFCILYSQQWGKIKASEWLGTFVLSFFQDFFILDPVKVIILAIAMAVVFRKPALKMESVDSNALGADEEYTENPNIEQEINHQKPKPLGHAVLERLRLRRRMEKDLYSLMRDIVLYVILLAAVFAISFGNRDPQGYQITDLVHRSILDDNPGTAVPEGFAAISNTNAFMEWIDSVFVPTFFATEAYNGERYHWRQRAFLEDLTNYRVGPARFRQLRMPMAGPPPHGLFENTTHEMVHVYDMLKEETSSFCLGWKPPPCAPEEAVFNFTSEAWKFTPAAEIWGVPMWGERKVYGGGGYIAELNVNKDVSQVIMEELWRSGWIDRGTRAVFVEFTLYNPNINLFGVIALLVEYGETGGLLPFMSYKIFRLYLYEGVFGLFMMACQIIFVIFLAFNIFNEGRKLYRQRCSYFSNGWQLLELFTIIGSILSIVMFVARYLLTHATLRQFHHDPTRFVNFQHVATYDENMGYFVAVVVFFYTIKFLRILNFNKRVSAFLAVMQVGMSDLISYMAIFITVYLAFAVCGYLYFGKDVKDYASIVSSCEALLSTMLGKNQYGEITRVSSSFGQFYFTLYALISAFGLVNLLIAILCDAIYNVRLQNLMAQNRLQLVDFVIHRLKETMGFQSSFDFGDGGRSSRGSSRSGSSSNTSRGGSTSPEGDPLSEEEHRAKGLYDTLGTQVDQLRLMVWKDAERTVTGDPWDCWTDVSLMLQMYGYNTKSPRPPDPRHGWKAPRKPQI